MSLSTHMKRVLFYLELWLVDLNSSQPAIREILRFGGWQFAKPCQSILGLLWIRLSRKIVIGLKKELALESVEFCLVETLSCFLHHRQTFVHCAQSLFDLSGFKMACRQQGAEPCPLQHRASCSIVCHSLTYLRDPFVYISLLR